MLVPAVATRGLWQLASLSKNVHLGLLYKCAKFHAFNPKMHDLRLRSPTIRMYSIGIVYNYVYSVCHVYMFVLVSSYLLSLNYVIFYLYIFFL